MELSGSTARPLTPNLCPADAFGDSITRRKKARVNHKGQAGWGRWCERIIGCDAADRETSRSRGMPRKSRKALTIADTLTALLSSHHDSRKSAATLQAQLSGTVQFWFRNSIREEAAPITLASQRAALGQKAGWGAVGGGTSSLCFSRYHWHSSV